MTPHVPSRAAVPEPRDPLAAVVYWFVQVDRGVLGKSQVGPTFGPGASARQQAQDWLAQFGPIDGRVMWR